MWYLAIVIAAVCLWIFVKSSSRNESRITTSKKDFVVITGCDSGFGLSAAECLVRQFSVIATVLNVEGNAAKGLTKLGVNVVTLNYLEEGSIGKCVGEIGHILKAKGGRLHGIVNNAGICHFGEFDWMTPEHIESMFKVNSIGPVLLIKELMDEVFASKSRIVNVTSMAAKTNLPFFGLYTSSKIAFDSFTFSLRTELSPHGIPVIAIRPGNFIGATGLLDRQKAIAGVMWKSMTEKTRARHGNFWEMNEMLVANQLITGETNTSKVVTALEDSLLLTHPSSELDVCPSSLKLSFFLMSLIPMKRLHKLFGHSLRANLWLNKQYKLFMAQ